MEDYNVVSHLEVLEHYVNDLKEICKEASSFLTEKEKRCIYSCVTSACSEICYAEYFIERKIGENNVN